MSYLRQASEYAAQGANQRDEAQKLSKSTNPDDKAKSAKLSRLADRNTECALGAIRNELGMDNSL